MAEPSRDSLIGFLAGVLGLLLVAFVVVVVFVAFDEEAREATPLAAAWRDYERLAAGDAPSAVSEAGLDGALIAEGRDIYVREGCWYCHTQAVRPVVGDFGLGGVTTPGDLALESQDVVGVARLGPDLAHAGSREPTDGIPYLVTYVTDPRSVDPASAMPAYGFLSDEDLLALGHYLASLR